MSGPARTTVPALPDRTDVVIVGAGPTGLALAAHLASAGVGFLLLDRRPEGAGTSRAGVVHARTLETLEPVGAAAPLVERGLRLTRFGIRRGRHRLATVAFDGLPTPYPYALLLPQYETEAVLLDRVRALGGSGAVRRPYTVTGVGQEPGGAVVTVDGPRGTETVRAAYAVGADGMRSTVREAAGIGYRGGRYAQSFALADVRMEWLPGREEVSMLLGPDGPIVVAPLPGDVFRVVAAVREAPGEPDAAFVQRVLDERAGGQGRVGEVLWSSRFHVHHRIADRYRAGGILLAGDAAHVHSPAGGQGMNIGIQDACALGRALADVLTRGADPDTRLDAYERERRPVAERVISFTDRLTRAATVRSLPVRAGRDATLRLLGLVPAWRTRLAAELAGLRS
ncbi:FAD-dependent oxidoreductase [Streptomyces radiopugnans]|uniref:2-polyprenyl-6-methoxyphenol hydroxylase n=1 Tax=Streptomyces radiopugnans TaxID=403935 RepID=A0A1H9BI52_9ACTN|nr:FAD-dependent oxidoreductase [Streptomyces radiopugnans]SEP88664.1 2-polyprenyl-6-methoxyphenol hydroxylase [Streptomyces radiopugnans]